VGGEREVEVEGVDAVFGDDGEPGVDLGEVGGCCGEDFIGGAEEGEDVRGDGDGWEGVEGGVGEEVGVEEEDGGGVDGGEAVGGGMGGRGVPGVGGEGGRGLLRWGVGTY
jgi:hypothetical protein